MKSLFTMSYGLQKLSGKATTKQYLTNKATSITLLGRKSLPSKRRR